MQYLFYRPLYGIVPLAYSGTFSACFFEEVESCEWELTKALK